MDMEDFECDLEELSSAEDFLEYFNVSYDQTIVHVNRLHILQRFHDYIQELEDKPSQVQALFELYAGLLASAYNDFVVSDAQTEKVFKVFRMNEPVKVEIPLMDLTSQVGSGAT